MDRIEDGNLQSNFFQYYEPVAQSFAKHVRCESQRSATRTSMIVVPSSKRAGIVSGIDIAVEEYEPL